MEYKLDEILSAIFSDETALFRTPSEPDPGDVVAIRIRTLKDTAESVRLIINGRALALVMRKVSTEGIFDYFETELKCINEEVSYYFEIECAGEKIIFNKLGAKIDEKENAPEAAYSFRFTPGFHVPAWAKGALQYQIFTDRFCNGNPANDTADNEYYYVVGHSKHINDWNALPDNTDIRCFYGGDLQGIMQKLDYLQSLGVEAIYLNPIFVSPSSHKYDTQDYDHIDPHFAVISDDVDHAMQSWEKHNGYAAKYIRRVTSHENLKRSDEYFAEFCSELHRRGMKIILDGVFNHCGSFNKWMDREGIYLAKPGYEKGAYQDTNSPFRKYFNFDVKEDSKIEYEGWWGLVTLPKLNYEESLELRDRIYSIAQKWALPPYCIDGWRLDVAADLGHSKVFNHEFWKEFRTRLKTVNPDILIIAEHYGDPSSWLEGDQWDTVMNYDAFMEPVTWFLTGIDKHSDNMADEYYQDGEAFFRLMKERMAALPEPSLYSAMNELSNHDHSRFLTRTNRTVGRITSVGSAAAGENIDKAVFREAVCIQMTWPGSPTIYYADEAGQVGWTDPDNRRTYPWGNEDRELIDYHRQLAAIRSSYPVLKTGSIKPLYASKGIIAYSRFTDSARAIVACNNTDSSEEICLKAADAGAADGTVFARRILSDAEGFSIDSEETKTVDNGCISITLPPKSAVVYTI